MALAAASWSGRAESQPHPTGHLPAQVPVAWT